MHDNMNLLIWFKAHNKENIIYTTLIRAVWYYTKFAYHNTKALVSRYTLGIDSLHDMAYMTLPG